MLPQLGFIGESEETPFARVPRTRGAAETADTALTPLTKERVSSDYNRHLPYPSNEKDNTSLQRQASRAESRRYVGGFRVVSVISAAPVPDRHRNPEIR